MTDASPQSTGGLAALGWDDGWEQAFAPHRSAGCQPGRVAIEDKHAYRILLADSGVSASVAGRLIHEARSPAALPKVGDWVAVALPPGGGPAVVQQVLPRRTTLARKVPGREVQEQVLAANVDIAFVVQALDASFNLRRLERFLVLVHEGGIQPVVVLNKTDLCATTRRLVTETQQVSGATPVLAMSALTGDGLSLLQAHLRPGRTCVFLGPSGVGKSSLINRIYGEEIQATIEVRVSDAKGRHSTTWRELIPLPTGGLVIDTPGMRECHLWLGSESVLDAFPDIEELGLRCRFRDCRHAAESDCAVQAALAEGRLGRERYDSYCKLRREQDFMAQKRRTHTYLIRKREAAARSAQNHKPRRHWPTPEE